MRNLGQDACVPQPHEQPDADLIAPGVVLPPGALRFTFARASGPGGQNVNKVNTQAILTVTTEALAQTMPGWAIERLRSAAPRYLAQDPERLVIASSDSRSQLANRRTCLLKLRHLLIEAMNRPRPRRATRPSRAAVQRRIDAKKHRARLKSQRQRPAE